MSAEAECPGEVIQRSKGETVNPLDRIERLLTCPICLDRYKQPKLLSCQHTFCLSCLESYVDSSGIARPRIRCPECRTETALEAGCVQSLQTNLTLMAFLEIHLEASDVNAAEMQAYVQRFNLERCRVCEEKAELELCAHCERKCCAECRTAHVDMLKRDLGRLLGQVRRLSSRVVEASKGLSRGLEQLASNGEQTKSEIREYFNRYQKELRRREENFIEQVDLFVQTEDRLMRTLRDALDVEWNNLQDACLWVEAALDGQREVRDDELARFKTVFAQGLEYLRSFQPDSEDLFAKKVRFSPGDDAAKLPTAIANFGELNVSLPQFANRYLPLEQQYLPRPFRLGLESEHFMRACAGEPMRTTGKAYGVGGDSRYGTGMREDISTAAEGESHESAGALRWRRRRELEEEAWSRLRAESGGSVWTSGRGTPSGAMSPLNVPSLGTGSLSPMMPISPAATTTSMTTPQPATSPSRPTEQEQQQVAMKKKNEGGGVVVKRATAPTAGKKVMEEEKKTTGEKGSANGETKERKSAGEKRVEEKETEEKKTTDEKKVQKEKKESAENKTEEVKEEKKNTEKRETDEKKTSTEGKEEEKKGTEGKKEEKKGTDGKEEKKGTEWKKEEEKKTATTTTPIPKAVPTTVAKKGEATAPTTNTSVISAGGSTVPTTATAPKNEAPVKKAPTTAQVTAPTFTTAPATATVDGGQQQQAKNEQAEGSATQQQQQTQQQHHRGRVLMINGGGSAGVGKSSMTTTPRRTVTATDNSGSGHHSHRKPPLPIRQFSMGDEATVAKRRAREEEGEAKKKREQQNNNDGWEEELLLMRGRRRTAGLKTDEDGEGGGSTPMTKGTRGRGTAGTTEGEEEEEEEEESSDTQDGRGRQMHIQSQNNRFRIHCRSSSHDGRRGSGKLDIGQPIPVSFFPTKSTGEWSPVDTQPAPLQSGLLTRSRTNPDLFADLMIREALETRPRPKARRESREGLPPMIGIPKRRETGDERRRSGWRQGAADGEAVDLQRIKPRPRLVLGRHGTAPEQMNWPRGVCALPPSSDGDDLFAVADSSNHRVQVFSAAEGTLIRTFGKFGNQDGEFDGCCAVCVNIARGELLVADRYNHRVQMFDLKGQFIRKFGCRGSGPGQFLHCWGIAVDEQLGLIYVADKDNHRVQMFDVEGAFLTMFGSMGDGPSQFNHPLYLAFHGEKRLLYVSDSANNRISMFSPDGTPLRQFRGDEGFSTDGQLKLPRGIAVDEQGRVVVADSGNSRVQAFSPSGRQCLRVFGTWGSAQGQFKGVEGVCLLRKSGQLVVADRENNRVQLFSSC